MNEEQLKAQYAAALVENRRLKAKIKALMSPAELRAYSRKMLAEKKDNLAIALKRMARTESLTGGQTDETS